MLNLASIDKVSKSGFSSSFCKPLYDSYCFSRIPATIEHLLTGKKLPMLPKDCLQVQDDPYDMVVLFFIDAFGWTFFEKYQDKYPFLSRFVKEGIASKITSQFPSTTAAHVTTINSGDEVGQTGVYEWFYYEPVVDRMIAPLLFSYAGDKALGSLEKAGITPKQIFPNHTIYQKLKKQKISSYLVQPENIVNSHYSRTMSQGAIPIAYLHFEDGLKTVAEAANDKEKGKSYFLVYFPDIDSMGHRHGVDSEEFEKAVDHCMRSLEEFFWQKIQNSSKKIACLLTADHGMVEVDPKTTLYINKELPSLKNMIVKNSRGQLLVPAGSCRDLFLHIEPDLVDEALKMLTKHLEGKAECYKVSELIEKGFFGSKPVSDLFLARVGNVVILPFEKQSVWWHEKGRFEQHFYASHGGLTRKEMESVFLFTKN
jgi:predicted AlkP superfamily pyrophosphatase or phosphodiesterase